MKRLLCGLTGMALWGAMVASGLAQANPRGKTELVLKGKSVSIEYGRPSLKGRTVEQMLKELKPGQVWRLGADQSTTFSTGIDLAFGNVKVPKGVYSLWARREAGNKWQLVFNQQHGQWGTNHNPSKDLYSVPLKESKAAKSAEMVTIKLTKKGGGGNLTVHWGDMVLSTAFKAK